MSIEKRSEIQSTGHMESERHPLLQAMQDRQAMQGHGQGERGSEQGDGPKTRSELIELAQTEDRVVPPEAFRGQAGSRGTYEHHTKVLIPGSSEFLVVGDNNGHTVYAGTPETVERLRADFWRRDDWPQAHNILTEALHPHMEEVVFGLAADAFPQQVATLIEKSVLAGNQKLPSIKGLEAAPQPDAIVEFGRHYEDHGVKVEKQEISLDNINAALLTDKSILLWRQITENKPMV
ncbi:MAG: hypothetical protein J2P36_23250, partial [Ktedonobacteraceae bacterium]|nr:hypothetical protein [Ktedonobacteraceae bacterium]